MVFVDGPNKLTAYVSGVPLPLSMTRAETSGALGAADASGPRIKDDILGEYGAWDVFRMPKCRVHVEYDLQEDSIWRLTFSLEKLSHQ